MCFAIQASPSSAISSSSCVFRVSSCGLPSLASHTTSPPSGKRPPILLTPPQYGITPFYPSNSIPSSFLRAPHAPRVEHGSSSGARTAVFDWWSDKHCPTKAPAGGSDRPVQSVPGTGRTGPAGTGRTNLSDQLALALVGQCPSGHRSNTAVRALLELPCSTG
ncbi:hypothetical protein PCASD_00071 [Puccinia coronata f. sp. avenae]|uniref:Uncharacterized protein n=1 Tax=Puccinia coronata f. sp. avenae TaxID=200324 RepID=A0A2N5VQM1_9BASI|nr:hypothetical protein PCASD_00071 [Puccinia coronata f. sp. avenae]